MNQNQEKSNSTDVYKLNILAEMASYRIEELLEELEVEYKRVGKAFHGCCPIHGGDRTDAWNFYPDGHTVRGIWKCRSRNCDRVFVKNLFGLVRGILSRKNGWTPENPKQKQATVQATKKYLLNFLGKKWDDIKVDNKDIEKAKFISQFHILGKNTQIEEEGWSLSQIRQNLNCPSKYYLNRKYQPETLESFMIGEPVQPKNNSPMINRVIVPILNKDGTKVVGITGRSQYEKCSVCSRWHNPSIECPIGEELYYPSFAKWRNTNEFETRNHIYNIWNNKDSKSLIIVEGPGDVWRLHESGITNSVALFGCVLSDQQQIILESSKAMNLFLLLDEDSAGKQGILNIKSALDRMFNIKVLSNLLNKKDVGEMTTMEIRERILPCIK